MSERPVAYRLDLGGTRGPLVSVTLADLPPDTLVVELPENISKNRLTHNVTRHTKARSGKPSRSYIGRAATPEYEAYKLAVWAEVMRQTTPEEREALVGHRLELLAWVKYEGKQARWDAIGIIDGLADALCPALGVDDAMIWTCHVIRVAPDLDPLAPACRVAVMRR